MSTDQDNNNATTTDDNMVRLHDHNFFSGQITIMIVRFSISYIPKNYFLLLKLQMCVISPSDTPQQLRP